MKIINTENIHRIVVALAHGIVENPEGGSILIFDQKAGDYALKAPKTGIAVAFDKTTEKILPEYRPQTFTRFEDLQDWVESTLDKVTTEAIADAVVAATGEDIAAKYFAHRAADYLCVGWWKNDEGRIVLDWSIAVPKADLFYAAALAKGAKQEAVYVIDTEACVKIDRTESVKAIGFDIAVVGRLIRLVGKVQP